MWMTLFGAAAGQHAYVSFEESTYGNVCHLVEEKPLYLSAARIPPQEQAIM